MACRKYWIICVDRLYISIGIGLKDKTFWWKEFKFKTIRICSRLLNHLQLVNTITAVQRYHKALFWGIEPTIVREHITKLIQEHRLQKTKKPPAFSFTKYKILEKIWYSPILWKKLIFLEMVFAFQSSSTKDTTYQLTHIYLLPWLEWKILFLLEETLG